MSLDLSVIVPIYNKKDYIRACVDSLLADLPPRTEILLMDDGSTDGSAAICDSYADRPGVRVIHQPNQGLAQTRNNGLALASGAYIGFCDGDDFVHPQMMKKLLSCVRKQQADMIVCSYVRTPDRSTRLPDPEGYTVRRLSKGKAFQMIVEGTEPLKSYAWNKLIRRELFEGITYPKGRLYEDQFTTYRLVDRAETVLVTDWPAYCYVDAPDSITNDEWKPSELDYIQAWRELAAYCFHHHPEHLAAARAQVVSACVYSYSRLKKSGTWDPDAERMLKEEILKHGQAYRKSGIQAATKGRKLYVQSLLMKQRAEQLLYEPSSMPEEGIYVEMNGRLGNQMFRYAFARWLMVKQGKEEPLFLDFTNIYREREKGLMERWEDSLKDFRVLPYRKDKEARRALERLTTREEKSVLSMIRGMEAPLKKVGTNARLAFHTRMLPWLNDHGLYLLFVGYDYPFTVKTGRRKIVSGPFECARYCEEIRDILVKEFVPRHPLLESSRELMERIATTNSVCVTIRRGNYLQYSALNVCTPEYFERAAERMRELVKDPVFFVFSDDISWAKTLHFPGEVYYESGTDPVWEKLRLMTSCRHFIISNSTFSWWAQFLGQAEDKQVIAPDHWFNGEYQPPLTQEGWHYVEV